MTERRRFLRFNAVGVLGFGVQFLVLWGLVYGIGVAYLPATVLAVEAAVIHNFFWHERWTWQDLPSASLMERLMRLVRFNLSNGLVSLAGNALFMVILVGSLHLPVVPASGLSVAGCSLLNFALCRKVVFRSAISLRPDEQRQL